MSTTKPLLAALNGQALETPPFWFLRQAGRYLPEYREVRAQAGGFLDMCYTPKYAVEVTLQPIRRFGMDAAIIFSDILVVPHALGADVRFEAGEGPKLEAVQNFEALQALKDQPQRYLPVYEAIASVKTQLPHTTAMIGFCGSPWTLACYMVEGGGSKNFESVSVLAYQQPDFFDALIEKLTHAVSTHAINQIEAGAEVIQLFDSWAGIASVDCFERYIIAPTKAIVARIKQAKPEAKIIGFPRGAGLKMQAYARQTGVDALHVDQFTPLTVLSDLSQPLQGNIDPIALMADVEKAKAQVRNAKEAMLGKPYILNLGHGVLQHTPPAHVQALCTAIRESL